MFEGATQTFHFKEYTTYIGILMFLKLLDVCFKNPYQYVFTLIEYALAATSHGYILGTHMNEHRLLNNVM